jgi:hypothetical protein
MHECVVMIKRAVRLTPGGSRDSQEYPTSRPFSPDHHCCGRDGGSADGPVGRFEAASGGYSGNLQSSQPQSADLSGKARAESPLDSELLEVRQQLETEALNRMRYGNDNDLDRIMRDLVPFSVFLVVVFVLLWVLRVALDNRRWYRMVRVQTEVHTKLLDRFASSQELTAYMESDAGKRFLEAPRFDTQTGQPASFPFGRILWSVQAGLIAGTLGCGLLYLRGKVPNGNSPLLVFGTLAIMLGLGFILSAIASYFLSKHFGLLTRPEAEPDPVPPVRRGVNI